MSKKVCLQCNKEHNGNFQRDMCNSCYNKWYRKTHPEYVIIQREKSRQYYRDNIEKEKLRKNLYNKHTHKRRRELTLKRKYSLTLDEYNILLNKQNFSCKICKSKYDLVIDHCHKTNKVRGILCRKCNSVLGLSNDNIKILENCINYLNNKEIE